MAAYGMARVSKSTINRKGYMTFALCLKLGFGIQYTYGGISVNISEDHRLEIDTHMSPCLMELIQYAYSMSVYCVGDCGHTSVSSEQTSWTGHVRVL